MSTKGSFSYKNTTINGFDIGNGLQVRVETINSNVASVIVTDAHGNPQPMPPHITLVDANKVSVRVWNNAFLVTWFDSYVLRVNGIDTIWMTNQKQQEFAAAAGITHFTI